MKADLPHALAASHKSTKNHATPTEGEAAACMVVKGTTPFDVLDCTPPHALLSMASHLEACMMWPHRLGL